MRRAVAAALTVASLMGCATPKPQEPAALIERELKLAPGYFTSLPGTALGDPIDFDNDIYGAKCYPLMAATGWSETLTRKGPNGHLLLWIHRAHVAAGRTFIQQCEVGVPVEMSATRIAGYTSDAWFEATRTEDAGAVKIQLRRIEPKGWSAFAAPSFCGQHVAYWSQVAGGEMTAQVASLFEPASVATASFGVVPINASDNGMGVPEAAWTSDCTAATFTRVPGETRTVRIPANR